MQANELIKYQTEDDFQQQIIELAHTYGWAVAHFRKARKKDGWYTAVSADGQGFPDLVLVHSIKKKVLFVELKSETGRMSKDQLLWKYILAQAGANVYTWKPSMWDYIVGTLNGKDTH